MCMHESFYFCQAFMYLLVMFNKFVLVHTCLKNTLNHNFERLPDDSKPLFFN